MLNGVSMSALFNKLTMSEKIIIEQVCCCYYYYYYCYKYTALLYNIDFDI